jgi:L-ascorbate metabolism protein UlaG (beta-lactamase superfamily)
MPTELTWLGHASWQLNTDKHTLLIDPFLDDNPVATVKSKDVAADFILCSHGHFDHVADAAKIAGRTGATIVSNYEICEWFAKKGVKKTLGMNLGGSASLPFGRVKMTIAFHSSQLPDGSYGGNPGGFLISLTKGPRIYFACDTALFSDMKLIGGAGIDLAVLPIGDLFTMGPKDSVEATKLLSPSRVVPSHFNTWPPIAQDPQVWAEMIRSNTTAVPIVLKPGEKFSF